MSRQCSCIAGESHGSGVFLKVLHCSTDATNPEIKGLTHTYRQTRLYLHHNSHLSEAQLHDATVSRCSFLNLLAGNVAVLHLPPYEMQPEMRLKICKVFHQEDKNLHSQSFMLSFSVLDLCFHKGNLLYAESPQVIEMREDFI